MQDFFGPSFYQNAAEVFEAFVFHAVAEAKSNEVFHKEFVGTLFIDDVESLKLYEERAKFIIAKLREKAWGDINETAVNLKRYNLDFDSFTDTYLIPGTEVTEEMKEEFINDVILDKAYMDAEGEVAQKIKAMKYQDFLQTPYWKIISEHRKNNSNGCVICGSKSRLEVHHPTYEWHGYEHRHVMDLVVLCHNCHAKVSPKKEKNNPIVDNNDGGNNYRRLDDREGGTEGT